MQNHERRSRLAGCLALGLAIAAIAVPVAQAEEKTLNDYPLALAREAARSYGPLSAAPIKTLSDYPAALGREAAGSYGPLPAAPIRVVSQPDGFDWRDAAIDAATVSALVLVGTGALVGPWRRNRQRTA
jgi:hypothetical protein